MILYPQAQTKAEINEILTLQSQNLPKNLGPLEIQKEGFLTVEHNFDLLWEMNTSFPHTLAKEHGKVVGYALSMTPKFALDIPVLKSMFEEIEKVFKGGEYIVMGQICVAKTHRGQGVFRGLYKNMQTYTRDTFGSIITEVDIKNIRSMNAHKAIGFKELSRYAADEKVWSLIQLK